MMPEDTAYRHALDWLFSRTRGGAPRSVQRMTDLRAHLGLPAPARVVHVVGTNGKGTVSAMIQAGLSAAGTRTGLFISPHVEDFRERISIDGRPVSRSSVTAFTADMQRDRNLPPAAFFELTLALALRWFAEENVGCAVIEAGVGARNDATRAVGNTVLSVLTAVATDHADVLGSTVSDITRDKTAALSPGRPLVTMVEGEALAVARAAVQAAGSGLVHPATHPDRFTVPERLAAGGTRLYNQKLAAAALRTLGTGEAAVEAGISRPPLPGRGERFTVRGRTVILDGAHDPAAARALTGSLPPGYTLVFGVQEKKQRAALLHELARHAARTVTVPVAGNPAPADAAATAAEGLQQALADTPRGGVVLIAGSLYLAGELRPLLSELAET